MVCVKEVWKKVMILLVIATLFLSLAYASEFVDDTEAEFNQGTYSSTEWSADHIELSSGQTGGSYASQIFDAGSSAVWNNISWTSNDIGALPSDKAVESGAGGANMTDNTLLLHLDEASGSLIDSSGEGNTASYNGALYQQTGKVNYSIGLDGSDDIITVNHSDNVEIGLDDFTIELWVNRDGTSTEGIIDKADPAGHISSSDGYDWHFTGTNSMRFRGMADAFNIESSATVTSSDGWTHIAVTGDRDGNLVFYKDGAAGGSSDFSSHSAVNITSSFDLRVGVVRGSGDYFFEGDVDEIAFYKRALSQTEIQNHYKRGITRLNLTTRTCDDAACSGESWTDIIGESPQTLSLTENQYFQYNFSFKTDDSGYSPELYDVTLSYNASGGSGEEENSAPSISSVSLTTTDPATNYTTENLTGTISASDTDGDNITYAYSWYKNGDLTATTLLGSSIIAYYPLNNDTLDYHADKDAYIYGAVPAEGKLGAAYEFDGTDDYIQADFPDTGEYYSFGGWIYPDTIANGDGIISTRDPFTPYAGYGLDMRTGDKIRCGQRDASINDFVESVSTISAGEWAHVMCVNNGTDIIIYINGEEDNSASSSGTVAKSDQLTVGRLYSSSDDYYFDGKIDEVLVYNRTLSSSEVQQLYLGTRYGGDVMGFSQTSEGDEWVLGINAGDSQNWSMEMNSTPITVNTDESGMLSSEFVPPTPDDNSNTSDNYTEINASITNAENLEQIDFEWNGTNYSFYDDNLIFMADFDELAAIGENSTYSVDISKYANNGTLKSGAAFNTDGVYGKSVYLGSGNGYVEYTDSDVLNLGTQDFTFEFWVKRLDSGTHAIMQKGSYDADGYSMFFSGTDHIRFRAESSTVFTEDSGETITSADGWTHIVAVADRDGNMDFYKNGELSHSSDISSAVSAEFSDPAVFEIGHISGGSDYYSDAYFDNFRIYNRTMTAEEVKQHYYANLYKFNESKYIYYTNPVNLNNGTYTYAAYAEDNATTVSTGTRTLTIGTAGNESQGGDNETNETETNSTNYNITIITDGVTTTEYNYSDGTLENVEFNETGNFLHLSSGTAGNFTSQVFDAGTSTQWNNIS
ncbi:hypothetical protein GF336_05365, partial [Candidatus Woesearchaeota archaeon]|nr:hypothetical protein [Candidatus Woesearchaeota archaeon]